ncbi:MAG: c-type cytochrome [Candidatus Methylomirabilales bacterium]
MGRHRDRMGRSATGGALLALLLVVSGCGGGGNPQDGERIYAKHCGSCHGETGSGDGPTARLTGIKPANLAVAIREKSRAEILGTISKGRQAMPAFGRILTDAEREAVYQYLRTLAEKRAAVSPGLDPTGDRGLRQEQQIRGARRGGDEAKSPEGPGFLVAWWS